MSTHARGQTSLHSHTLPPYAAVLGLHGHPFPVTPDETAYFFTDESRAHWHEMTHFLEMRKGFMLLTGDIGLGKTTFLRYLIASLDPQRYNTALLLSSFLNQDELLESIARDFGLTLPARGRRIDHLGCLNNFLLDEADKGKINVLFIDDAQALDPTSLDVIRQFSNLETSHSKLIQIVLCGQPELLHTLDLHSLRQVKSRIAMHLSLRPLSRAEVRAYVEHRLEKTGRSGLVTAEAAQQIHTLTGGFPRRIHHLMDRCLYALMARGAQKVDAAIVRLAWADLGEAGGVGRGAAAPRRSHLGAGLFSLGSWLRGRFWPRAALAWGTGLVATGFFTAWLLGVPPFQEMGRMDVAHVHAASMKPQAGRPAHWSAVAQAWPDLGSLDWPVSPDAMAAMHALDERLRHSSWQLVVVPGELGKPCEQRPVLQVTNAQGGGLAFSFVENHWPQHVVAWGKRSAGILEMQALLSALGRLDERGVDGVMGQQTTQALVRFQREQGLVPTGQPDAATAYRLSCAALARTAAGAG